jgi:hypothetical protein
VEEVVVRVHEEEGRVLAGHFLFSCGGLRE